MVDYLDFVIIIDCMQHQDPPGLVLLESMEEIAECMTKAVVH
jgi:hypothetical protein